MEQLLEKYPNDLRFVYRQYPLIGTPELPFHDKAALATQATEAANMQGKFWEMHDVIFENQATWTTAFSGRVPAMADFKMPARSVSMWRNSPPT